MLLPLSFLTVFSGAFIDAYAVDYVPDIPAGGKYLTSSEALEVFSRDITYKVWTGSEYVTRTSTYSGTKTGVKVYGYLSDQNNTASEITTDFTNPNTLFLQFPLALSDLRNNDNYPALIIDIPFTLTNTDYFYTSCCLLSDTITATGQKPVWNWNVSGSSVDFSSRFSSLNAYADYVKVSGGSPNAFIPVAYTSQTFSDYSSIQIIFPRGSASATRNFYIACPYVSASGGVTAETQTTAPVTTSVPTTGTDINVNVDMSETNSILDRIRVSIGGLIDGIQGLFVPSEEDVILWKNDIADILDDTFGGIPQLEGDLKNTITQLISTQANSTIQIPDINIPYVGTLITARSVALKPSGFDVLFDAIRLGADIVVTVWVFNMVQDKIKALLVGETVVDRIGD